MASAGPDRRVDVERRIKEFIGSRVDTPVDEVPMDVSFLEAGMGSLDAIDILFAVEEEFDLVFSEEDSEAVRTPRDLVELTLRELQS